MDAILPEPEREQIRHEVETGLTRASHALHYGTANAPEGFRRLLPREVEARRRRLTADEKARRAAEKRAAHLRKGPVFNSPEAARYHELKASRAEEAGRLARAEEKLKALAAEEAALAAAVDDARPRLMVGEFNADTFAKMEATLADVRQALAADEADVNTLRRVLALRKRQMDEARLDCRRALDRAVAEPIAEMFKLLDRIEALDAELKDRADELRLATGDGSHGLVTFESLAGQPTRAFRSRHAHRVNRNGKAARNGKA